MLRAIFLLVSVNEFMMVSILHDASVVFQYHDATEHNENSKTYVRSRFVQIAMKFNLMESLEKNTYDHFYTVLKLYAVSIINITKVSITFITHWYNITAFYDITSNTAQR